MLFPFSAESNNFSEEEIKAAYIYNFLHFFEWQTKDTLSLNVCIYGSDENDISAFESMPEKTKSGRNIKVIFHNVDKKLSDNDSCHTIFINKKIEKETENILKRVNSNEIITIGESNNFIKQGGMINFVIQDATIGFDVNVVAIKKANLTISSQILRLANKVFRDEYNE